MKLFSKTAEDFGITYTGIELDKYDQKHLDSFEKDKYNTSKGQVKFYFIEIIFLAINLLIAFDDEKQFIHPVITVITAALPLIAAVLFIFSHFIKDAALRRRIRIITSFSQFMLLLSVSASALASQNLFDFLLTIANLIIGFIAGMMSWSKITMKTYLKTNTGSEKSARTLSILAPIIAAAMVPVIRGIVGVLGEDLKYGIGKVLLLFLSGLFGWLFGLLTQNIRYYIFLKKQKGLESYEEEK